MLVFKKKKEAIVEVEEALTVLRAKIRYTLDHLGLIEIMLCSDVICHHV